MDNINMALSFSNIFVGALIIALSIPLLWGKIGMNRWYGMRFKKSFESKENWYKINRYGAKRMMVWSAVIIAIGMMTLLVPAASTGISPAAISCAPVILIIPAIEGWLFARKL